MRKILTALPLAALTFSATTALADTSNLTCLNGFKKVRTYGNAIKCKAARGGLHRKDDARAEAALMMQRADCNAHQNRPKNKVWRKNGKWAYRVTFICALIH